MFTICPLSDALSCVSDASLVTFRHLGTKRPLYEGSYYCRRPMIYRWPNHMTLQSSPRLSLVFSHVGLVFRGSSEVDWGRLRFTLVGFGPNLFFKDNSLVQTKLDLMPNVWVRYPTFCHRIHYPLTWLSNDINDLGNQCLINGLN